MWAGDYRCRAIKQDIAGFVHFDDIKFCIHDHVNGFGQLSHKMHFQSEVSLFYQVEMSINPRPDVGSDQKQGVWTHCRIRHDWFDFQDHTP